jgi:Na+/H+ antiporter NhaD/arsenite permease-like protein
MFTVSISSSIYLYLIFRKDFNSEIDSEELKNINPIEQIKDKKEVFFSLLILFIVILIVIFKEYIFTKT